MQRRAVLLAGLGVSVAGCGSKDAPTATFTATPVRIGFVTQPASGLASGPLSPAVKVTVQDANGGTITGSVASITITITPGTGAPGALLRGTVTRAAVGGVATFNDLTIDRGGTGYRLNANTAGLSGVTSSAFDITSSGDLVAFVGQDQVGLVGSPVNFRPAVRFTDAGGMPLAGQAVTFTVTAGNGSITGASATTNANGVAQVTSWVLGAVPALNTVSASVGGSGIGGNPTTFSADGQTAAFNIAVRNVGPPFSAPVQAAFAAATTRWQQIIFRDLQDISIDTIPPNTCYAGQAETTFVHVDDILIYAKVDSIDGPGGILGQAGPCGFIRSVGLFPIFGAMQFDSADIADLVTGGELDEVIEHEMGHVLGFGPLWICLQSPSNPPGTIRDTHFNCARAVAAFDSIGGTSYTGGSKVPVENCGPMSPVGCGQGTVNAHWREPVFGNELMTGYLDSGIANPLSLVSVAAMEDIGYGVSYAAADPYPHTFTLRAPGGSQRLIRLENDVLRRPLLTVDPSGRVAPVIPPH